MVRLAYNELGSPLPEGGRLSLPGGGLQAGETPDITAKWEVYEETGIVPGKKNIATDLHYIGHFFLHKSAGEVYLFKGELLQEVSFRPDRREVTEVILMDPWNIHPDTYPAQEKLIGHWLSWVMGKSKCDGPFHLL